MNHNQFAPSESLLKFAGLYPEAPKVPSSCGMSLPPSHFFPASIGWQLIKWGFTLVVWQLATVGGLAVASTTIDGCISKKLAQVGVPAAPLCSDSVFVRRVYLDAIGTLPTAGEAADFINDTAPEKRAALIERLLSRDEFADYWAMRWSDVLRVKAEFPINLWPNAAQAYHHWIRTAIRDNLPYDQFARALLLASGSNFRSGPANFYRTVPGREPRAIASAVALTFMGTRTDRWTADRLDGMAAFFTRINYKSTLEWKEEIVFFDPLPPGINQALLPDGKWVRLPPEQDPRAVFADWLVDGNNPWFARAISNRLWYWLLGRGIVHEPDDLRPDNPPSNPALLDLLARELVAAKFDLKHLHRLILNSHAYQRSSIPPLGHPEAVEHFACYPLRRLDAEVLIDAINQITGTHDRYSSVIPEPFTFIPLDARAIALPDGSITSSFLELFGRPARDTGLLSERTNVTSAGQRLHLLNSSHIQKKLASGPGLKALLNARGAPDTVLDTLYLTVLSRFPTDHERAVVADYARTMKGNRYATTQDIAWALINTAEFLHRH